MFDWLWTALSLSCYILLFLVNSKSSHILHYIAILRQNRSCFGLSDKPELLSNKTKSFLLPSNSCSPITTHTISYHQMWLTRTTIKLKYLLLPIIAVHRIQHILFSAIRCQCGGESAWLLSRNLAKSCNNQATTGCPRQD